jgi:hypothetical protein
MLEIINSVGLVLEVDDDVSIPVQRFNNSFTGQDLLFQDIVYNATSLLTPKNKQFIKQAQRINASADLYSLTVEVKLNNALFFKGNLDFKINDGKIEWNLKPNLTAYAKLIAESSFALIQSKDQVTKTAIEAGAPLMLDTCNNPQNYPYVFAPIYNLNLGDSTLPENTRRKYVNYFDFANQRFDFTTTYGTNPPSRIATRVAPHLKLQYVVKLIAKVLGYNNITGDWINSPEATTTYIETLGSAFIDYNFFNVYNYFSVFNAAAYMPNQSISYVFKTIIARFQLSVDFRLDSVYIVKFANTLNVEPINLSAFLENEKLIDAPQVKGYSINLKVNESDDNFNTGTEQDPKYEVPFSLIIGDGATTKELEAGTLKQVVINGYQSVASSLDPLSFAVDAGFTDNYSDSLPPQYQIRFFKYDGMQLISSGKYWPQTSSLEITEANATLYNFKSTAKPLVLEFNIPHAVLRQLSAISLISFFSKEGDYVTAICERIAYDLKLKQSYVKTEITCRQVNLKSKQNIVLKDNLLQTAGIGRFIYAIKSNKAFTPIIIYTTNVNYYLQCTAINTPSNKFGLGGEVSEARFNPAAMPTDFNLPSLTFQVFPFAGSPKTLSSEILAPIAFVQNFFTQIWEVSLTYQQYNGSNVFFVEF